MIPFLSLTISPKTGGNASFSMVGISEGVAAITRTQFREIFSQSLVAIDDVIGEVIDMLPVERANRHREFLYNAMRFDTRRLAHSKKEIGYVFFGDHRGKKLVNRAL